MRVKIVRKNDSVRVIDDIVDIYVDTLMSEVILNKRIKAPLIDVAKVFVDGDMIYIDPIARNLEGANDTDFSSLYKDIDYKLIEILNTMREYVDVEITKAKRDMFADGLKGIYNLRQKGENNES